MKRYHLSLFIYLTIFAIAFSFDLSAKSAKVKHGNKTTSSTPQWEFNEFFPDFEVGLLRENRSSTVYQKFFDKKKDTPVGQQRCARLNLLKKCYQKTVEQIRQNAQHPSERIPRIIHQIWLGSAVPKRYNDWMQTWAHWHGWEYKLWTDEDVAALGLINQEAYDQASNYGEKSDIVRLEVLYLMGGLYVDVDFKCVQPHFFDLLHETTDFYIGIEPLEHELLRFGNSLLGSAPGHPLLAIMINNLSKNCEKVVIKNTLDRTGPRYITRLIYEYLESSATTSEVNLFLPAVTFFPYNGHELFNKNMDAFPPLKGTAAIHYWTGSWALPPSGKKNKRN